MPRRPAVAVAEPVEQPRVLLHPPPHPGSGLLRRGPAALRLVVVADRKQQVDRLGPAPALAAAATAGRTAASGAGPCGGRRATPPADARRRASNPATAVTDGPRVRHQRGPDRLRFQRPRSAAAVRSVRVHVPFWRRRSQRKNPNSSASVHRHEHRRAGGGSGGTAAGREPVPQRPQGVEPELAREQQVVDRVAQQQGVRRQRGRAGRTGTTQRRILWQKKVRATQPLRGREQRPEHARCSGTRRPRSAPAGGTRPGSSAASPRGRPRRGS